MPADKKKKKEIIVEPYLTDINALRERMTFFSFNNGKPYSFDYDLKHEFDAIVQNMDKELKENTDSTLSTRITNKLPVFLPNETVRIAFFSYRSKSVRPVDPDAMKFILTQRAEKLSRTGKLPATEIKAHVLADLDTFEAYRREHDFDAYRLDVYSSAIQFNAYDECDNLLIEKSSVRGGLVFAMKPEAFAANIAISYPRHRKQRSDKKQDYLPLKLIQIRGINFPEQLPDT